MKKFSKLVILDNDSITKTNLLRLAQLEEDLVSCLIEFPTIIQEQYIASDDLPGGDGEYSLEGWVKVQILVELETDHYGTIIEAVYQDLEVDTWSINSDVNIANLPPAILELIKKDVIDLFTEGYFYGIDDAQVEFVE